MTVVGCNAMLGPCVGKNYYFWEDASIFSAIVCLNHFLLFILQISLSHTHAHRKTGQFERKSWPDGGLLDTHGHTRTQWRSNSPAPPRLCSRLSRHCSSPAPCHLQTRKLLRCDSALIMFPLHSAWAHLVRSVFRTDALHPPLVPTQFAYNKEDRTCLGWGGDSSDCSPHVGVWWCWLILCPRQVGKTIPCDFLLFCGQRVSYFDWSFISRTPDVSSVGETQKMDSWCFLVATLKDACSIILKT